MHANGSIYEGEWKGGKWHGSGEVTYADGAVYKGAWTAGVKHGKGTYIFPNGDVFDGEWKEGQRSGKGTLCFANGDTYTGQWKENKYHGKGKCTFVNGRWNGDAYEGHWKNGVYHGKGTFTNASGNVLHGTWVDGVSHGKGTLKEAGGDEYEKEYNMGKLVRSKRVAAVDNGPSPKCSCTVDTSQAKEMQEDLPSTITPTNEEGKGKASETTSPSMLALQDYDSSEDESFAEDEEQTADGDDQSQDSIDFMELCHRLTDKVEKQKRTIKSLKAQVKLLKKDLEAEEAVPWGARNPP
ncbi:hypothetical protein ACHAXT_005681 [Thalassiosira profunda]